MKDRYISIYKYIYIQGKEKYKQQNNTYFLVKFEQIFRSLIYNYTQPKAKIKQSIQG